MKALLRVSIAIAACGAALLWNGDLQRNMEQAWVSSAYAVIGRPLTPMSYAGVARRTTRRAVAVGTAYGAAAAAGSGCVQAVDAYGRVYTRCY